MQPLIAVDKHAAQQAASVTKPDSMLVAKTTLSGCLNMPATSETGMQAVLECCR